MSFRNGDIKWTGYMHPAFGREVSATGTYLGSLKWVAFQALMKLEIHLGRRPGEINNYDKSPQKNRNKKGI